MHRRTALLLAVTIVVFAPPARQAHAETQAGATGRPDSSITIQRARDDAARPTRLEVRRAGKELGGVPVPADVSLAAIDAGLKTIVWHPGGRDFACAFARMKGSFVVVFLVQGDGTYRAVDVSQVETANIGGIGPNRQYREVRSTPVDWLPRTDDSVQLRLRTDAWDMSGRHYRMQEPLIITRAGQPLWR